MYLRMYLTVVGILTLSVLSATSEHLFKVDIDIPQKEGRKEIEDIEFINSSLSDPTGVNVMIVKKAFDNQRVTLVADIERICGWSSLTSAFSEKGYKVSVTPLQTCSDYAAELGVNVTYHRINEIISADVTDLFNVVFHDAVMNTDDYITMMQQFFERDATLQGEGNVAVCYRSYGELPLRLMYLALPLQPQRLEEIYQEDRVEGKASVVMSKLQRLDVYTEMC